MAKISVIEGVGKSYEETLRAHGIRSVEKFLQACATKKARTELAEKTGISEKLILKWTNHADLMRIKGIGGQYSELLEAAGVDTVVELATRNPENLFKKLQEVNAQKELVRNLPTLVQVEDWVKQAAYLPRVMQH
ncbi:MAG TPA: DUF4332 domain-containing protein [Clostridia bacterium]|jgi:predicted flap endonuclease-1-like 5' DNA nuclease|nr:MAG: DNA polymerase IV [Firmicutes bacterium ADurb.Bin146]HOD93525.1 DUF4332 domain-containing protein [Clostridia bacterium]HQM39878.1 DUF4332 domain-containing protein [Clostridia bacterium]